MMDNGDGVVARPRVKDRDRTGQHGTGTGTIDNYILLQQRFHRHRIRVNPTLVLVLAYFTTPCRSSLSSYAPPFVKFPRDVHRVQLAKYPATPNTRFLQYVVHCPLSHTFQIRSHAVKRRGGHHIRRLLGKACSTSSAQPSIRAFPVRSRGGVANDHPQSLPKDVSA